MTIFHAPVDRLDLVELVCLLDKNLRGRLGGRLQEQPKLRRRSHGRALPSSYGGPAGPRNGPRNPLPPRRATVSVGASGVRT